MFTGGTESLLARLVKSLSFVPDTMQRSFLAFLESQKRKYDPAYAGEEVAVRIALAGSSSARAGRARSAHSPRCDRHRGGANRLQLPEKSWLSVAFDLVLVGMLVVCAISIVQSLAHAQLKRLHEQQRAQLKKRHSAH